jgi:radical SAM superfamily enzyme YgiQ (UPF0313 family)
MITSRGCPYRCVFCDSQRVTYRFRSPKNVVDEMEKCKSDFSINEIDIFDALFSLDQARIIEVCRQIKARKLDIDWSFRTRVDLMTEALLRELREAGCIRIYYGIESGNPAVLKNINKSVDIEMIKKIVRQTKETGIEVFGFFMIGNIGETKQTIRDTMSLIRTLPFDYIQVAPAVATPRSELYELLKKQTKYDYWREYTLYPDRHEPLPHYGTVLSDAQIKHYVRRCYLAFIKRASRLRSFDALFRSLRAFCDMLFSFALRRE